MIEYVAKYNLILCDVNFKKPKKKKQKRKKLRFIFDATNINSVAASKYMEIIFIYRANY